MWMMYWREEIEWQNGGAMCTFTQSGSHVCIHSSGRLPEQTGPLLVHFNGHYAKGQRHWKRKCKVVRRKEQTQVSPVFLGSLLEEKHTSYTCLRAPNREPKQEKENLKSLLVAATVDWFLHFLEKERRRRKHNLLALFSRNEGTFGEFSQLIFTRTYKPTSITAKTGRLVLFAKR